MNAPNAAMGNENENMDVAAEQTETSALDSLKQAAELIQSAIASLEGAENQEGTEETPAGTPAPGAKKAPGNMLAAFLGK